MHALVADHRMSTLLIRAVRNRKGVRAALALAGATPWTRRNFGRWLFEGYPRALLATPRRWLLRMNTATMATGEIFAPGSCFDTPAHCVLVFAEAP